MCSFPLINKLPLYSLYSLFRSNYFSAVFPFLLVPICCDISWFQLYLVALILSLSKLQPSKYIPVLFIIILAFMPCVKRRDFFY